VLSRDSRQERKLKAFLRAEFALKQRLDRIDYEEDVVMPQVEAMKSGKSVMQLPEGYAFDIQVINDAIPDHHQKPESD